MHERCCKGNRAMHAYNWLNTTETYSGGINNGFGEEECGKVQENKEFWECAIIASYIIYNITIIIIISYYIQPDYYYYFLFLLAWLSTRHTCQ